MSEMIQNLTYSESESDDDENHRFYSVCAENKINAMMARMREYDENFERPEEFENEAVSMAIQQHGLKNYENQSTRDSFCDCGSEENRCNQNASGDNTSDEPPTTSKSVTNQNLYDNEEDYNKDDDVCCKNTHRKHCSNSEIQNIAYKQNMTLGHSEFNDDDHFLNEAVAVAITKKGLSSSSCNALK